MSFLANDKTVKIQNYFDLKVNRGNKSSKILFQRLGIISLVLIILLLINNHNKNCDIEDNRVENKAKITSINYISYIDNARAQHRISYYEIELSYQFDGSNYNNTLQLAPYDSKTKIGRKLNKRDEITIFHSFRNPENITIKK